MNAARLREIEKGLKPPANKVYEVIPIQECWDAQKIQMELTRIGKSVERRNIDGSLKLLREYGLIKESSSAMGHYRKVLPVEVEKEAKEKKVIQMKKVEEAKADVSDSMVVLSELAAKLRITAEGLGKLAEAVEDAALRIEQEKQADAEAMRKLKVLKELFAGS
jgi:hypothetical protein